MRATGAASSTVEEERRTRMPKKRTWDLSQPAPQSINAIDWGGQKLDHKGLETDRKWDGYMR